MIDCTRSKEPPESLAKKRGAFEEDVKKRLLRDFHRKCYLCESVIVDLQIDHFRPKFEFEDLTFEWSNLFPSDGCNQRRPKKWPEGGFIDPTDDTSVEERLLQWIDKAKIEGVRKVCFAPAKDDDEEAANTAALLNKLHNEVDRDGQALSKPRLLRERINDAYTDLLEKLAEYSQTRESGQEPVYVKQELLGLLSSASPYAGVMRGTLRRRGLLPKGIAAALK